MQNHERRIHDWIPSSVGCSKKNLRGLVKEATTDLRTLGNCCKLEIFNSVNDEEDSNGSSEGISVSAILRS